MAIYIFSILFILFFAFFLYFAYAKKVSDAVIKIFDSDSSLIEKQNLLQKMFEKCKIKSIKSIILFYKVRLWIDGGEYNKADAMMNFIKPDILLDKNSIVDLKKIIMEKINENQN